MFLLAAISLGFLGSFHCIGMCGPIALTIPVRRTSSLSIIGGGLVYNLGRVFTYACLGLIFGLLGQGFVLAGGQSILSIVLGIIILALLIFPRIAGKYIRVGVMFSWVEKLKSALRRLFGMHSIRSLLFIGILNGLLPCGLVYLGITGAIATGNVVKGALFMVAFGAGTLPAMLAVTVIRDYISVRFRQRIRSVVPVLVGAMAVLLILRGMNLGIPYVSPSIESNGKTECHKCCHK
ncbi:MAG: sulfite exporter TauE/SafE family protein [Bacteroidia bacterium]|jgi:sulfite exporter TauE/SafE